MEDLIEDLRLQRLHVLNVEQHCETRVEAQNLYGIVWDPQQLAEDFEVQGYLAPYAIVRRKADGRMGSLEFQHHPRYYFNWTEHEA